MAKLIDHITYEFKATENKPLARLKIFFRQEQIGVVIFDVTATKKFAHPRAFTFDFAKYLSLSREDLVKIGIFCMRELGHEIIM